MAEIAEDNVQDAPTGDTELRLDTPAPPEQASEPELDPPSLDTIRVKAPGVKGINRKAILIAAGGGIAGVLVLVSGALPGNGSREPVAMKPMMSDPARPEMAKGAIRSLPADYSTIMVDTGRTQPTSVPELGPPLPGDVAAFADPRPKMRSFARDEAPDWNNAGSYSDRDFGPSRADPREAEALEAERAGLFFVLREEPRAGEHVQSVNVSPAPPSRLTAFAAQTEVTPTPQDTSRLLFSGAIISASLLTEVNSEAAGPVVAQVTQAVFDSATGRTLVIPQGAKLIGSYKSATRYGEGRAAIVWASLIMPDGREVPLPEAAVDPSGAAGVVGRVDNHWQEIFGAAALGTLLNVGVATLEEPRLSYPNAGVLVRDPVEEAISNGIQRATSTVTNQVVDRGLAIPPTIRVPAGTKVSVIVTRRTAL